VGGGGGTGGSVDTSSNAHDASVTIGIGGAGGSAGNAGAVSVTNGGALQTGGDAAAAIFAESVGGGGGSGSYVGSSGNDADVSLTINVGGSGGSAGNGGATNVTNDANITTIGADSAGIFAQSVGGGGGFAGGAGDAQNFEVSVGASGGSAGNGGAVSVTSDGSIITRGADSSAILAQSVGGGGGSGGSTVGAAWSIGVSGSGGGAGDGGNVSVTQTGSILTTGASADGIFAQSIGGGGGLAGNGSNGLSFAGSYGGAGSGGNVSVTASGNVLTTGNGSFAIFAQSAGGTGSGTIDVNVSGGRVIGGSGSGAGIAVNGAGAITIENGGYVGAASGIAILGSGSGDTTIDNIGTIVGSVLLGTGENAFTNEAGATFAPGAAVNLGSAGSFVNDGIVSPGGTRNPTTTLLTGSFAQNAGGALQIDFSSAGHPSDYIEVTGAATLTGTIAPFALDLEPNTTPITFFVADGGLTANDLQVTNTPFFTFDVAQLGDSLNVSIASVHFAQPGLTANQNALGNYFNAVWNSGSLGGLHPLMYEMANAESQAAYAAMLDRLSPATYLSPLTAVLSAGQDFTDSMLSCYRYDDPASLQESACSWARAGGGTATQTPSDQTPGLSQTYETLEGGHQWQTAPGAFIDVALGYRHSSSSASDYASSTGDAFNAGAAIKRQRGPWLVAGALHVGAERDATTRKPYGTLTASSSDTLLAGDALARAAYVVDRGDWYVKPYADLEAQYVHVPAFSENGAGALDLQIAAMSKAVFSFAPTLEAGSFIAQRNGTYLHPFASLGARWISSGTWQTDASFEGAPAGVPAFTASTSLPTFVGNLKVGFEVRGKTADVRFDLGQLFGHGYSSTTGALKADWKF
jgi:uncharacterized protein with beta-barrel porin domain